MFVVCTTAAAPTATSGTQVKLGSEHTHRLFIVAGVASRYKHVDE
jgi:hypothetical protein